MKKNLVILSLPCILSLLPVPGWGDIRVGNYSRSYAENYNQVSEIQQQNAQAVTLQNLPIRVANKTLADKIARNDTSAGVTVANLDSCANIYPSGSFAWDTPTAGLKAASPSTCIAVVEMRVVKGTQDIVVARANVAAGDSIKCNISEFPESSYTSDASKVVFPADREPTVDDVIKVMNDEQKKNAAFKIAAGAVVGGLVGNVAGKNDLNENGLMGTNKGKMQGTAIGALSGAALMAGSSYSGKVGGDVIMSAGVNAAAGGVVGNIIGNGDSVLRIEDCEYPSGTKTKCLWGNIIESKTLEIGETGYYNIDNSKTMVCGAKKCDEVNLVGITFADYTSIEAGNKEQKFLKIRNNLSKQYVYKDNKMVQRESNDSGDIWTPIATGGRPGKTIGAMILDFKDKTFGIKMSDWYRWRNTTDASKATILVRDNKGQATDKLDANINNFYPLTVDADDGGVIDINNKARLKSTVIGAGAGAGIGAFTAYQGAQDEIDSRWISAVQEYKDSLQKVYCATGTRFLSSYNDLTVIPNMQ